MRQVKQNAERMDGNVDLAREALHLGSGGQGFPTRARAFKEARTI